MADGLDSEVAAALRRYVAIQKESSALEEEKRALKDRIVALVKADKLPDPELKLDGETLWVRCTSKTTVTYDEAKLQAALGDAYAGILGVDAKKLKDHLAEADKLLAPILPQVGSPSRAKIKAAVEAHRLDPAKFAGTFTKETVDQLAVVHPSPEALARLRSGYDQARRA